MNKRAALLMVLLGIESAWAQLSQAPSGPPDHATLSSSAACVSCHAVDAQARWEAHRGRPCDPYCLTCHSKEDMAKHHPVGNAVSKAPRIPLRLTAERKSACFTCHDVSTPRHDSVRWKAESLYGRWFRKNKLHKTYYLVTRNDRGQLCLACH